MPNVIGSTFEWSDFSHDYDPERGRSLSYTFEGTYAQVIAAAADAESRGIRCHVGHEGVKWFASINTGGNREAFDPIQTPEIPADNWETDTEQAHEDFWAAEKIISLAATVNEANGSSISIEDRIALWKDAVELALSERDSVDLTDMDLTNATINLYGSVYLTEEEIINGLYDLRIRGTEHAEITRPILRRTRYISRRYAQPAVVEAIPRLYTTPSLVAAFQIPALIAVKLPTDPVKKPTNTIWSWKLRKNDSRWHSPLQKWEETMEWYFASWTAFFYDFV